MNQLQLFIDGKFVDGEAGWFDNINPVNGTLVAKVAHASANDVDRAVQAGKKAMLGEWGTMSIQERGALLSKVAERINERSDEFLAAEIADTGKPKALAAKIDIPRGAANFQIFADQARSFGSESFMQSTPDGKGAVNYVQRVPLGVVGVICPWNLPLLLMTWKVAPALAAGNTVVVKPSEETPSTATLLAEVISEILPPGVFNLVHGFGPGSAGEAITKHPDISAITFTGESATGETIMKIAAEGMKAVSFELGGKNPAIIFEDADFDAAVAGTLRSVFTNCGQICLCSERVYVERPIFDKFVEALKNGAESFVLGDPLDSKTSFGPLISKEHREKVLSYFELAVEEGATVVCGGGIPTFNNAFDNGYFIEPTIWTGLSENARVIKEEIFGPVCHIQVFDTESEVIEMANDSEYGLAASVWTQNVSRAHRVSQQIEAGIVWVNDWYLRDLRTPFGGVKRSGLGREGGIYSLNFYSELKNICIKL